MILIVCSADDRATEPVVHELESRNERYLILHPESIPNETYCTIMFRDGTTPSFEIKTEADTISSNAVHAVWYWHPKPPKFAYPGMRKTIHNFCEEEWNWFIHGIWRATSSSFWLNHPKFIREADFKPYQLKVAQEIGLSIPDTVVSNDPAEICRLYTQHEGRIIQKTIRAQFGFLSKDRMFPLYTVPVNRKDLRDQQALSLQPAIYQANIEKRYDIRVTVVGHQVFAVEIHSQLSEKSRQDFRCYDLENTPYLAHKLPKKIEEKCRLLVQVLRLDYGAIDMILTPDGRYVFLEINPSGQYGWIEGLTGMKITSAICDLLTGGAPRLSENQIKLGCEQNPSRRL